MSVVKALEFKSVQDLVIDSELVTPVDKKRNFEFNLNDKSVKSKILKGAKRLPFEIKENITSSNLIFCIGTWQNVVIPTIKYLDSIKGDKTCDAGTISVRVASVSAGEDASKRHIDTLVVFYANRDKIVCHFYNTTQLILVNGHGYEKLIDHFLKPYFESKVRNHREDIVSYNSMVIETLGPRSKRVKRSTVKYKGGSTFPCKVCDFTASTLTTLNKHKSSDHALSFNSSSSLLQIPLKHSTRNNSISEALLEDNINILNLSKQSPEITLEETGLKFTCLECKFVTTEKLTMDVHVQSLHGKSNFVCKLCEHEFLDEEDYNLHVNTHEVPKAKPKSVSPPVVNILENDEEQPGPNENETQSYRCNQCAFTFPEILDLSSHIEMVHAINVLNHSTSKLNEQIPIDTSE